MRKEGGIVNTLAANPYSREALASVVPRQLACHGTQSSARRFMLIPGLRELAPWPLLRRPRVQVGVPETPGDE